MKNAVNVDKAEQVKSLSNLLTQPKNLSLPKSLLRKSQPQSLLSLQMQSPKACRKHEQSMISVKLDKLNRLLDLVAEIVITEGSVISSPDLKKPR